jgi:hypothetical protein
VWAEPLRTATRDDATGYTVGVTDNERQLVATLRVDLERHGRRLDAIARTMRLIDQGGTARQNVRALALLIRAALIHAAQRGATHAHAYVSPQVRTLAMKITGNQPGDAPGPAPAWWHAKLTDWLQNAREATDGDGNLFR